MNTQFLLEVLACPKCHSSLELLENAGEPRGFACAACEVVYPVENDIPVMLIERAVPRGEFTQKMEDGQCAC